MSGRGVVIVDSAEELAHAAADAFGERMRAAARATATGRNAAGARRIAVALAGGATPRGAYELLGHAPRYDRLPWAEIDWFFGDERGVEPRDAASNFGMAEAALLGPRGIAPERVHRLRGEAADLAGAADAYAAELPERLDLIWLGVGADGHTASLFPGAAAVAERLRRVVAVTDAPKPPARRLTLTPPVICAAGSALVLAAGLDKAGVVARALEESGPLDELPIRCAPAHALWLLDRTAAAGLRRPPG
ncbi:MAG: 6-phosphogluconolactonase [Planctomycetes bacterium]|nr:6-phosphogluconolactonase [Planctomycetota bacterium]